MITKRMTWMAIVVWLEEVGKEDISVVGGKGASLGEMINIGIPVPGGFAVTAQAFRQFIERTGIAKALFDSLNVDVNNPDELLNAEERAKSIVMGAEVPKDIENAIKERYRELCEREGRRCSSLSDRVQLQRTFQMRASLASRRRIST